MPRPAVKFNLFICIDEDNDKTEEKNEKRTY